MNRTPIQNTKKTRSGFTLIELVIALSIAAILVSIAVPSFSDMIQNNRLTSQTNQFIAALTYARSEAIKRSAAIDVTATSPSSANEWGSGLSVQVNGGAVLKVFSALDGSTLNSTGNNSAFQYLANGRATITDTFDLCDGRSGETGRRISISTTGRASTADLACS